MLSLFFKPFCLIFALGLAGVSPHSLAADEIEAERQAYQSRLAYLEEELEDISQQLDRKILEANHLNLSNILPSEDLGQLYKQYGMALIETDQDRFSLIHQADAYKTSSLDGETENLELELYELKILELETKEEIAHYDYQLEQSSTYYDRYDEAKRAKEEMMNPSNRDQVMTSLLAFDQMHWPCEARIITSTFGMRRHPIFGSYDMHTGLDIAGGGVVLAAADAVVESVSYQPGYGFTIILKHTDQLKTLYAHLALDTAQVVPGQLVKAGQVLAQMGTTGNSTGIHLHFEVRQNGQQLNPLSYLP